MARSRRQNGGPTRDTFKKKRLGKGWLANNKKPQASRPVLRITEPVATDAKKG
jgi:hypothetical protein